MYIWYVLINALSAHIAHINLNMIFYTHVEHSPTFKKNYVKYYKEKPFASTAVPLLRLRGGVLLPGSASLPAHRVPHAGSGASHPVVLQTVLDTHLPVPLLSGPEAAVFVSSAALARIPDVTHVDGRDVKKSHRLRSLSTAC